MELNLIEINSSDLPSVTVNPELNKYDNIPMFQNKVDKANEIMRRVGGLPDLYEKTEEEEAYLLKVNGTVEKLKRSDRAVKNAVQYNAPPKFIEQKESNKAQLVAELITLLAEMDVQLELKQTVLV